MNGLKKTIALSFVLHVGAFAVLLVFLSRFGTGAAPSFLEVVMMPPVERKEPPPVPPAPKPEVKKTPPPQPLPKETAKKPLAEPAPVKTITAAEPEPEHTANPAPVLTLPSPPQAAPAAPAAPAIASAAPTRTAVTGRSQATELDLFKAIIREKVERAKFYPRFARERGYEGTVTLKFTVLGDGSIKDLSVHRPCHCDTLNKAAVEAVRAASPFGPLPKDINLAELDIEMNIVYNLADAKK